MALFFFFQAEDGIRDIGVTGVQTCALPISKVPIQLINPVSKLRIEQLDGIFGAQRSGAFQGPEWNTSVARGPEKNIRNWGQLGLTGEWANKPIHVYGYNLRYHIPATFERLVFQGGAKWNEQLGEFTNYKKADGSTELEAKQVGDRVAKDPLGVGYSRIAFVTPCTKALAISPRGSAH